MGFRAVWPKYGFGLLECRNRGCCGVGVMCSDLRFPFQSSLSSLVSPRFCFLAPNHHPVLLPSCVLLCHPIIWPLLLRRSRSQIASDQQSQPIPDTLLARIPQEVFLVSDSIRLRSQISDFPIADRSHSGTPFKRHNPSRDQSFCDHDRDHNFDRAIRCAESLPRPIVLNPSAFVL